MLKILSSIFLALLFSFEIHAVPPPYPASTPNQKLIADQLESITNPNLSQQLMLDVISEFDSPTTTKFLNLISGAQYTSLFAATEILNRQFIRHLYDPLRLQIANPCSFEDEVYDLCTADGIVAWAQGNVGRSFLNGNKNIGGFKMSGYDVAGGIQKRLTPTFTFGCALDYSMSHLTHRVGGSTKSNTLLGAAYALYRPQNWYFLTNVVCGASTNDMHKFFALRKTTKINTTNEDGLPIEKDVAQRLGFYIKNRPNISIVSLYNEIGFDWMCRCFLVQPFIGFEASRFKRGCKSDHTNLRSLTLIYSKKEITNTYSRLGLHLTVPENIYDITCSLDVAWQYRLNPEKNDLVVRFAEFGTPFRLNGIRDERHSVDFAFTAWSELFEGWTLYLQTSGECWKHLGNYAFTGGIIFKW